MQGGRLIATPPGREEALVPALPSAARTWAQACRDKPLPGTGAVQVQLDLRVAADGTVRAASAPDGSQLGRCLAERANGYRLQARLPAETRVAVRLTFSP